MDVAGRVPAVRGLTGDMGGTNPLVNLLGLGFGIGDRRIWDRRIGDRRIGDRRIGDGRIGDRRIEEKSVFRGRSLCSEAFSADQCGEVSSLE